MIEGYREFEFDLPEALLAKLIAEFDGMESSPLLPENVVSLPEAQGVYQLLYDGKIVYIGKTDAESGLRKRLDRHAWTIQHRCNLDPKKVEFRGIRVFVFTAVDLETQLIKHYGRKLKVAWQKSGFGSNDPGRERDTTKLKADGFDANFPVDLDVAFHLEWTAEKVPASKILEALRGKVPYTVRWQNGRDKKAHSDLREQVQVHSGLTTAREVIGAVVSQLPPGWQATLLPGRLILYHEDRSYSAGVTIAKSPSLPTN